MGKNTFIQNIVGNIAKYDISGIGNATTLNMYQETVNSSEDYVNVILRSIPGMKTEYTMTGNCRGLYTVSRGFNNKPVTYGVFGTKLYMFHNSESYEIGTVGAGNSICHFCETSGYDPNHPHLIVADGLSLYAVSTDISVSEQVADFRSLQLPLRGESESQYIKPTHCCYMYGYLIINDQDSDTMFISIQYPFETRTEAGEIDYNIFEINSEGHSVRYAHAEYQPDNILAICSNGSRLFTFGEKSYQLFQYNDSTSNPFTSPDTAAQLIGIKAVNSLAQLGKYTLWLGSADLGNNGIYLNTGSVDSTRVSTREIERIINSFKNPEDAVAQIWQENQHIFYSINFITADRTFVYDITENVWHERSSIGEDNTNKCWRYGFATTASDGKILFATSGAVVSQDNDNWQEHDGKVIVRSRTGGVIFSNYNNFYIDALTFEINNGQMANVHGDAKIGLRFTADGSDWSDKDIVSIGSAGDYDYDCTFYSFGFAKKFSVEISTTDNFPFSIFGIKLNTSEMKI